MSQGRWLFQTGHWGPGCERRVLRRLRSAQNPFKISFRLRLLCPEQATKTLAGLGFFS